jgi:hypothetical protein
MQRYEPGYVVVTAPAFRTYFADHHVQLPLAKSDAVFFSPALFHAAGANRTTGTYAWRICCRSRRHSVVRWRPSTAHHEFTTVQIQPHPRVMLPKRGSNHRARRSTRAPASLRPTDPAARQARSRHRDRSRRCYPRCSGGVARADGGRLRTLRVAGERRGERVRAYPVAQPLIEILHVDFGCSGSQTTRAIHRPQRGNGFRIVGAGRRIEGDARPERGA